MEPLATIDDSTADWTVDQLIDFVVSAEHVRLRAAVRLLAGLDRLASELDRHFAKEEQVLFPYLRQLAAATATGDCPACPFGTVGNPIRMLEREHLEMIAVVRRARESIRGAPDGRELRRFEIDLWRHFLLEDQLLFPKALALETS
jgi:iron-sulfur cluster repair protein YtfE (RIC family)